MRPRAQGRHRAARYTSYVPAEVLEAQAQVALVCSRWRGTYPKGMLVGIELYFDCVGHPWRGDADNLGKLVRDALRDHRLGKLRDQGVIMGAGVYHDDRQVKRLVDEVQLVATPAAEGVHLHMYQLPALEVQQRGRPIPTG